MWVIFNIETDDFRGVFTSEEKANIAIKEEWAYYNNDGQGFYTLAEWKEFFKIIKIPIDRLF